MTVMITSRSYTLDRMLLYPVFPNSRELSKSCHCVNTWFAQVGTALEAEVWWWWPVAFLCTYMHSRCEAAQCPYPGLDCGPYTCLAPRGAWPPCPQLLSEYLVPHCGPELLVVWLDDWLCRFNCDRWPERGRRSRTFLKKAGAELELEETEDFNIQRCSLSVVSW